jgi:hypothetical protein
LHSRAIAKLSLQRDVCENMTEKLLTNPDVCENIVKVQDNKQIVGKMYYIVQLIFTAEALWL